MVVRRPQPGFTLIEMLVATGLVGLVLALALKGFTESKRIADMTRAKVIAANEASLGVQKVAKILKRAHIIFFDGRPLGRITAVPATTTNPTLGNLPATLTTVAAAGKTFFGGSQTAAFRNGAGAAGNEKTRASFRFRSTKFDGSEEASNPRLQTADTTATADFDKYFSSPTLYCAEAIFNTATPDANGVRLDPNLAMTWTFYVIYLCPMRFELTDDGNGLFPAQDNSLNGKRDKGPWGGPRTTVPLELRLLTIPDVKAIKATGAANNAAPADPAAVAPNLTQRIGQQRGRCYNATAVLPFPFDVKENNVNYDPVALAIDKHGDLDANPDVYGQSSRERVESGTDGNADAIHGNWDNIGNEPPSEQAYGTRARWNGSDFDTAGEITDTLIASYIDPDAVHGTFVRLSNDWRLRDTGETAATNPRPWVNAFGGPQRWNPKMRNALNPDTVTPPSRALVSVTTRFRTSRQTPFAFSTESLEVDLDALKRFQDATYRKRQM